MNARPERIGPYAITGELGRGGMGVVYRATRDDGAQAALKVMSRELSIDARFLARFEREARVAAAVKHRNVVALLGSGFEGKLAWIAFELIDGGSLKDELKKRGKLPWLEVASLGAQIARGLAAIHGAGMIHRDMKPANVLLASDGTAKVADLGLARRSGGGAAEGASIDLTRTGELLGTLDFISPEQADSSKHVDARADLYSLGATLYDLVTGRPPFEGSSNVELIKKHLVERPASPRSLVPDVPEALDRVILRLLEKDPDARGGGALELAKELEAISGARSAAPSSAPRAVAIGVALVVIAGGIAFGAHGRDGDAAPVPSTTAPETTRTIAHVPSAARALEPQWLIERRAIGKAPAKLPRGVSVGREPGEYVNDKDGSILVWVPGWRSLPPYFIGKFELESSKFEAFVKDQRYKSTVEETGGRYMPESPENHGNWDPPTAGTSWRTPIPGETWAPNHPVVQVSPNDAAAYCQWAGLRLPSESEWLHAAREEGQTLPWGQRDTVHVLRGNFADVALLRARPTWSAGTVPGYDDGFGRTSPVGSFPKGVAWCGALDMEGNVWELVSGRYMPKNGVEGPAVPAPDSQDVPGVRYASVALGGSYLTGPADLSGRADTLSRNMVAPHVGLEDVGFRVARNSE